VSSVAEITAFGRESFEIRLLLLQQSCQDIDRGGPPKASGASTDKPLMGFSNICCKRKEIREKPMPNQP